MFVTALSGVPVKDDDFTLLAVENHIFVTSSHSLVRPRLTYRRFDFDSKVLMNYQVNRIASFAIDRISPTQLRTTTIRKSQHFCNVKATGS